jgi:hypothetical protein
VIGVPVTALRGGWRSLRQPPPTRGPARPPVVVTATAPPRRATSGGGRVRVAGAEDNWGKGVRGEHAAGAR